MLTAALSVYNSCVYATSRMLYGLAEQGNAPRMLIKLDRRGVPYRAIGLSALAAFACVIVNYLIPAKALDVLMALVVAALVLNWSLISLTHLKSRKAMVEQGQTLVFRSLWFPLGNWLCLVFMAMIMVILAMTPGLNVSVLLVPVWLVVMWAGYRVKKRRHATAQAVLLVLALRCGCGARFDGNKPRRATTHAKKPPLTAALRYSE